VVSHLTPHLSSLAQNSGEWDTGRCPFSQILIHLGACVEEIFMRATNRARKAVWCCKMSTSSSKSRKQNTMEDVPSLTVYYPPSCALRLPELGYKSTSFPFYLPHSTPLCVFSNPETNTRWANEGASFENINLTTP
jgi:hypothetical protein